MKIKVISATLLWTVLLAVTAALAGDSYVFILDCSGSMWGQIDGTAKITIAKDVLTQLINDLPDDTQVGLYAYGHRQEGDCADVEQLTALRPINKADLNAKIKALKPKGKTPIAASVKHVVNSLKAPGTKIVLVSDGKENCDSEPCQLVDKLQLSGTEFVLHVVGFDVTAEERAQLECLASAGKGKYFAADGADELMFAAKQITTADDLPQTPAEGTGTIWFDAENPIIVSGMEFNVHFTADSRFHDSAWLGIIPAAIPHGDENVNDDNDVYYEYVRGRTEGTERFVAPAKPGNYTVRLHNSDGNDAQEVASADFKVVTAQAEIWLDSPEIYVSESIKVHFRSSTGLGESAWIGIVPSDIPHGSSATNDKHDISYEYVTGTEGLKEMRGPSKPGRYDVRLHDTADSEGKEIACASFRVNPTIGEVRIDIAETYTGNPFDVHFSSPTGLCDHAWIAIVPSDVEHGSSATNDEHDVGYEWVSGTEGTKEMRAPSKPGRYDVRLMDTSDYGSELSYATFQVKKPGVTATMSKAVYAVGEPIVVSSFAITGKLSEGAWAGIVPSSTEHGEEWQIDDRDVAYEYLQGKDSLTFKVELEPGSYDVRFADCSGGSEIGSVSFTVK